MKKHTIKKLFLAFSAFIMLFYSVFSVFASIPVSAFVIDLTGTSWQFNSLVCNEAFGVFYIDHEINSGNDISTLQVEFYVGYSITGRLPIAVPNSVYSLPAKYHWQVGDVIYISGGDDVQNQSLISWLYSSATLLSSPSTPTPSSTPTPQVATPTPDSEATAIPFPTSTTYPQASPLTSDTDFWERMGQNANGAWGVITSTVSGIFSNVVMRNLAIYIPLFGLILVLIIYTITLGGGDDN